MRRDLDHIRKSGLEYLKALYGDKAVEHAIDVTMRFKVEVPGWQVWEGFGGGGRFEGGGTGGAARSTGEIASDIGLIHRLTKSTPTVGLHILWFLSNDGMNGDYEIAKKVKMELEANGLSIGSISPTYFLAGSGDGSFSAQNAAVRKRYIAQTVLGAQIAAELGNGLLTLWWPDGTNYPGQRELQDKIGLMRDCTVEFWNRIPDEQKKRLDKVLFEYKVFEPGTYSTTVPDWGTARELSMLAGDKGGVLIDMGHHHHSTNIEQIVGTLIQFDIRGGFHFNTRYAADDDHSVQADYDMSKLFHELLSGDVVFNENPAKNWAYALDQMVRAEKRIPSVLKSVDALKRSIAKAALCDQEQLESYQKTCDLIKSNTEFERAILHTDTTPVVMEANVRQGLHPVPLTAYYESGYQETIERIRT
ncbi:MAG: L-rhamnose isomerase [Candidatus Latescibacteria bacterium]|nr:L-rhamnose isomerase [Candidatus Latescibacterota bacterium]